MLSPYNPTTESRYRGLNILALMASDYADPRWMTYRQAQAQGWQVRAGEKGTQIQHWIWEEARTRLGKDGNPELDNEGKPIKELVRLSRPKVMVAAVFNAEQIDGVPALEPERTYDWDPVEQAEKLLRASGAKIEHSQTGGAYYRLATDTIRLPAQDRFETPNAYYATALHELGHWSGHPDRLDRDLSNPFGSEGYAREELRAEIASMIIGSELGSVTIQSPTPVMSIIGSRSLPIRQRKSCTRRRMPSASATTYSQWNTSGKSVTLRRQQR
jgi:putative DNA primase/helicase